VGSAAAAAAAFTGGAVADWTLAIVAAAFPVLLLGLGATRRGVPRWALVALGTLLVPSAAGILLLDIYGGPQLGPGITAGALLMALGLGVAPLVVVGLACALPPTRVRGAKTPPSVRPSR
jgi:hypothetical protein